MKPRRLILLTLGIILAAGAVGVALALTPSIQRWALLRATAGQSGLKFDLDGISAGFSHLTLRGVRAEKSGLSVRVVRLEADYSLWQALFRRRLSIGRLAASGILVDASRLSRAKAEAVAVGAPAAAPGLLAQLELPLDLLVDDVRLEGRALLPGAPGKPPVEAEYLITGGKFAPGREGALRLNATVKNPVDGAPVGALNTQVDLRAAQSMRRSFDRVSLTAVVDAEGKTFSGKNRLKISAELARTAAGENYSLGVDTLVGGVAENLLAVRAALPAGEQAYAGDWTLKARSAQLEPFFLGGALPEFSAHGEGRFSFTPATRAVDLQGSLDAQVSRLEAVEPAWRAFGAVNLQAKFDVAEADGVARLRLLDLRLAGEQPVLEVRAAQAAEFNLKEHRLQVDGAASGELLTLKLHGLPLAWVRPFFHEVDVSGGMITGAFSVATDSGRLSLRATAPLRVAGLTVVQRGQALLTKADLTVRADASLAADELRGNFSEILLKTAAGDSFSAQAKISRPTRAGAPVTVSVGYTADLPKLLGPWLPWGRLRGAGDAEFTLAGEQVEVRRLNANLADAGNVSLFTLASLRPFNFDLATRRAAAAGDPPPTGAADLVRVVLGRIPLDHLPLNQPGGTVGGTVEQGEFVLAADGDKLTLRSVAPLRLAGVSLAQDGRPALTGLAVEARPALSLDGKSAATAQTGEVTVRNAAGAMLGTFQAGAAQSAAAGKSGTLTFNIEVPALASQPLFAGAAAVAQGRASGEIRASLGTTALVEARVTVNGLVARDGERTLPIANLSVRAVAQENGTVSVQAPLLLDRSGQRSDLNFSLDMVPAGRVFSLDGKLTGEHVELGDALAMVGVFLASVAPGEATPDAAEEKTEVVADTTPVWSRFKGRLLLDVKSVTRGADWTMTGLNGEVVIEPASVALPKLSAAFGDKGRFVAQGVVKFEGGTEPYRLAGDFSLTEFDAGKLFKALEPDKPATVEGVFTVAGRLAGKGATLDQSLERTHGRFELTSRQGIFRGLQRTSNKVSMTSKAVELGASVLGSIFGSEKATKAAEKVAGTAYFVDQLAQSVAEFDYDQLSVRLARAESLDVALEDFSLISPEIRLLGKGSVTHVAGQPLLQQPLNLSLAVAGRGKIEQLLGKLRLLDGTRDELGYAKSSQPVAIGGTLAKPDPSAFFTKVAASKLLDFLTPDN